MRPPHFPTPSAEGPRGPHFPFWPYQGSGKGSGRGPGQSAEKQDFSLRSLVSTSRRHKCLVSPASFFHLTRGGGRWKETGRERKAAKARGERPYISYQHRLHEELLLWERPVPPNGGRTPRSTFVAPQDERRTPRSTFARKMNAERPVLRSWPPKIM